MFKAIMIITFLTLANLVFANSLSESYELLVPIKQMTMMRKGVETFQVKFLFENQNYGELILTCDDISPHRRTLEWKKLKNLLDDNDLASSINKFMGTEDATQAEFYCFQLVGIAEIFAPFPNSDPTKEIIIKTIHEFDYPLEVKIISIANALKSVGIFSKNVHSSDGYKIYNF